MCSPQWDLPQLPGPGQYHYSQSHVVGHPFHLLVCIAERTSSLPVWSISLLSSVSDVQTQAETTVAGGL